MDIQQGFVLTRQARDFSGQTQIDIWVSTPNGPTLLTVKGERPVFFIEQSNIEICRTLAKKAGIECEIKALELTNFSHTPLAGCYTQLVRESNALNQAFNQESITTFEADIRLADRFLMERFIKGSIEFTGNVTSRAQHQRVTNTKCRAGDYLPTFRRLTGYRVFREGYSLLYRPRQPNGQSRHYGRPRTRSRYGYSMGKG